MQHEVIMKVKRKSVCLLLCACALPLVLGAVACGKQPREKVVGGIALVYVPGGTFLMGSPDGEGNSDEHPRHRVRVNGFWMGKYEVTQGQYEAVMGNNPSHFKGDNRRPVERVSWNDAVAFCQRFGERNNVPVRLPTEAEWEYACRGGTYTRYYWGNDVSQACRYANIADRSAGRKHPGRRMVDCDDGFAGTAPVGQFSPNAFGLYDMSGNVREWCGDWFGEHYYGSSPEANPSGPSSGLFRVFRGGSWEDLDSNNRSAHRNCDIPGGLHYIFGFRVVVVAGE